MAVVVQKLAETVAVQQQLAEAVVVVLLIERPSLHLQRHGIASKSRHLWSEFLRKRCRLSRTCSESSGGSRFVGV